MAVNEVIYGGKTLISLTSDTVTEDDLLEGVTAHDASGNIITGTKNVETQMKQATYTKNGIYFIRPDDEYYALDSVGITVNVPIPEYETWQGGSF